MKPQPCSAAHSLCLAPQFGEEGSREEKREGGMHITEMSMSQLAHSEGWDILMNDVSHRTQKLVISEF